MEFIRKSISFSDSKILFMIGSLSIVIVDRKQYFVVIQSKIFINFYTEVALAFRLL
jgi:hypothetical protein